MGAVGETSSANPRVTPATRTGKLVVPRYRRPGTYGSVVERGRRRVFLCREVRRVGCPVTWRVCLVCNLWDRLQY